jgi:hypothetical protein
LTIYFEKGNWTTENIVFRRDEKGIPIDETDILRASCSGYSKEEPKIIIFAHI